MRTTTEVSVGEIDLDLLTGGRDPTGGRQGRGVRGGADPFGERPAGGVGLNEHTHPGRRLLTTSAAGRDEPVGGGVGFDGCGACGW